MVEMARSVCGGEQPGAGPGRREGHYTNLIELLGIECRRSPLAVSWRNTFAADAASWRNAFAACHRDQKVEKINRPSFCSLVPKNSQRPDRSES